jgi:hypothetical protein
MYYKGTIGRFDINNPKNGHQRVIADRDNFKHLEVFMYGSWRHDDQSCREFTNKDCTVRRRTTTG